jgi:hypothetical protein
LKNGYGKSRAETDAETASTKATEEAIFGCRDRLMRAGALAVLGAGSASNSTITAIGGLGAAHRRQVRVLVGFYVAGVVSFTKR